MKWFEVLMFYGFREGEEPDPSDPDTQLLPELVDKVIVTKLTSESLSLSLSIYISLDFLSLPLLPQS